MENSNHDVLRAFLEFHVPLQLLQLRERGLEPFSPRFNKELQDCCDIISERGDTILYSVPSKPPNRDPQAEENGVSKYQHIGTRDSVVKLSKAVAMLLLAQGEIEVFGVRFTL